MSAFRVAYAPTDKAVAMDLVKTLKLAGLAASAAPLGARRAAAQPAPAMVVWTRRAAADPRIRALLRAAPTPMIARLEGAPAPPAGKAATFDARDTAALKRLMPQTAATSPTVARSMVAAPDTALTPPAKPATGKGWIVALLAVLAGAAGALGAWQMGYWPA